MHANHNIEDLSAHHFLHPKLREKDLLELKPNHMSVLARKTECLNVDKNFYFYFFSK